MRPSVRGILFMACATMLLTTQDAISKWLTTDYNTGEIMFWRNLFAFLPIAVYVWRDGSGLQALRSRRPVINLSRAMLNMACGFVVIAAFARMPLAETLAIVFASPIILTALSVPLLGEKVGWRRWSAVCVGFAGVLLIVRPTGVGGVGWVVLLPVVVAVLVAFRDIFTRKLGGIDSSTSILFYTVAVGTAGGAVGMAVQGFGLPAAGDLWLFLVAGLINGVGHYMAIRAFHLAEAAVVAPLRYLSLVWAGVMGIVFWGDVPTPWSLAGTALVVASGLYILHRESRRRRTDSG